MGGIAMNCYTRKMGAAAALIGLAVALVPSYAVAIGVGGGGCISTIQIVDAASGQARIMSQSIPVASPGPSDVDAAGPVRLTASDVAQVCAINLSSDIHRMSIKLLDAEPGSNGPAVIAEKTVELGQFQSACLSVPGANRPAGQVAGLLIHTRQ
jgi:hypothetical protein